ncbi:MAG TPA: protein-export chaperone SecB [Symbiobacteriaceae bacterium]|nr:protein-export chaperone SecB [Symbiobacteriaceae bacterium]
MSARMSRHTMQLREVTLTEIQMKRLSDVPETPPAVSTKVESRGEIVSDQAGYAFVRITLVFDEAENAPFSLTAEYRGTVVTEDQPVNREKFETFLKDEGVYLLWPYLRQLIAQLTRDMDFPPLTLPTLSHTKEIIDRNEAAVDAVKGDISGE